MTRLLVDLESTPAVLAATVREQLQAAAPALLDTPLRPWTDAEAARLAPYKRAHTWRASVAVPVAAIVGTTHPDFMDLPRRSGEPVRTWGYVLAQARRMPTNLRLLAINPGYYDDTQPKGLYLVRPGGSAWYVGADGNRRACLAKFYAALRRLPDACLPGVTVDEFDYARDLAAGADALRALLDERGIAGSVEVVSQPLHRTDGPGWQCERFRVSLDLRLPDRARWPRLQPVTRLNDTAAVAAALTWLRSSAWRRWFAAWPALPAAAAPVDLRTAR